MRLLPLGVGDAFSAMHYSSCVVLEADGVYLMIDCPHPIRKIMREAGQSAGIPLDIDHLTAIALTHLHADHCSGMETIGFYGRFQLGRKVPILAHPEVSAGLWKGHLAGSMEWTLSLDSQRQARQQRFEDYFQLIPLSETQSVQIGPFSLICRRTIHTIPTTGFQIRAGNRCLGYSGDTAYDPSLIEWLSPADLVIHETSPDIHTPYERLAALPEALRTKMRLIHYPDTFDHATAVIEPLCQGQWYTV
jgi:ribonuclease BN (tRNA processing enzyme)